LLLIFNFLNFKKVGCLIAFKKDKYGKIDEKRISYDDFEDMEKTAIEG
jgi:hypothetical protein